MKAPVGGTLDSYLTRQPVSSSVKWDNCSLTGLCKGWRRKCKSSA